MVLLRKLKMNLHFDDAIKMAVVSPLSEPSRVKIRRAV